MKRFALRGVLAAMTVCALVFLSPAVRAETKPKAAKPAADQPKQDPSVPAIKGENNPNNGFLKRHEGFLKDAKAGNFKLVFLGDSITDGWRGRGKAVWEANYAPLGALNLGIGGDQVQHVLWRVNNGEIDGISPKVAIIMIGTNNLRAHTDEQIAKGIGTLVEAVKGKLPQTNIMLLAIFPRSFKADDPARARIKNINSIICKLDDGKTVRYLDIGAKFLDADGNLPKEIMPDALHPNDKGYQIWADAIKPLLEEMLK